MKVYLAGPIFNEGDQLRSSKWSNLLRSEFPNIDLYSPIENTEINGIEGKKKFAGSKKIYEADYERLKDTDILLACIDGDVIPAGTSCEIGMFSILAKQDPNKIIVSVLTDNRQCYLTHSLEKDEGAAKEIGEQQYCYQNLFVIGAIKENGVLFSNIEDAIEYIKKYYNKK